MALEVLDGKENIQSFGYTGTVYDCLVCSDGCNRLLHIWKVTHVFYYKDSMYRDVYIASYKAIWPDGFSGDS